MSDETATAHATPVAVTPKTKSTAVPTYPKVSEMVTEAITSLKERGGSSFPAIKKHIVTIDHLTPLVEIDSLTIFVKKYLKNAVASRALNQKKGKGASSSFKLSTSGQKTKEPSKANKTKKEGASLAKKPKAVSKKTANPKVKTAKKKTLPSKKPKTSKPTVFKMKKVRTSKLTTPKKGKK